MILSYLACSCVSGPLSDIAVPIRWSSGDVLLALLNMIYNYYLILTLKLSWYTEILRSAKIILHCQLSVDWRYHTAGGFQDWHVFCTIMLVLDFNVWSVCLIHLNEAFVVHVEGFIVDIWCYIKKSIIMKVVYYFVYTAMWDFSLSVNYSHIKYLVNSWKILNVFSSLVFFYIYTSYAFWESLSTRSTCLLHTNIIYYLLM